MWHFVLGVDSAINTFALTKRLSAETVSFFALKIGGREGDAITRSRAVIGMRRSETSGVSQPRGWDTTVFETPICRAS